MRHPRWHLQSCPDLVEPEKGNRNTRHLTDKAEGNTHNNSRHLFTNSLWKMNVLLPIQGKHSYLIEEVRGLQDDRPVSPTSGTVIYMTFLTWGSHRKQASANGHPDNSSQHGVVQKPISALWGRGAEAAVWLWTLSSHQRPWRAGPGPVKVDKRKTRGGHTAPKAPRFERRGSLFMKMQCQWRRIRLSAAALVGI